MPQISGSIFDIPGIDTQYAVATFTPVPETYLDGANVRLGSLVIRYPDQTGPITLPAGNWTVKLAHTKSGSSHNFATILGQATISADTTWAALVQTLTSGNEVVEPTVVARIDAKNTEQDGRLDDLEAAGPGGGGGGAVSSVNAKTGAVVLSAADVGADTSGAATTAVAAHVAASDPHPQYLTPAEGAAAYDALGAATAAQSAASSDATTKANAAQAAAISAAATDATTKVGTETTRATTAEGLAAQKSANLSDLGSASTARTNLGLGTAATQASGAFDAAGAATTAQSNAVQRANHTGTQSADTLTDGTTNKAFLATERTKLTGIATGATANATDAQLRDRTTHTGTQTASTISDFSTAADARITAAALVPKSLVTAKGDVIAATASGAVTNVAVGADTYVLTADSTQSAGVKWAAAAGGGGSVVGGIFGDGSDGNVTISTTVTLTRDMFYDTLTVASGGLLKHGGFRIYAKTAINVASGGAITANGKDASGATAGGNGTGVLLGFGSAGGSGTTGVGSPGADIINALGGSGGRGGAGSTGARGVGGTTTAPSASTGNIRSLPAATNGYLAAPGASPIAVRSGAGGGAGGGDGTNSGGGGGGGADVLLINAKAVSNSGTISANGGAGSNGTSGNSGGGGGGGGGLVLMNLGSALSGTAPTVSGGTLGTGLGTGSPGLAGSAGLVLINVWQ